MGMARFSGKASVPRVGLFVLMVCLLVGALGCAALTAWRGMPSGAAGPGQTSAAHGGASMAEALGQAQDGKGAVQVADGAGAVSVRHAAALTERELQQGYCDDEVLVRLALGVTPAGLADALQQCGLALAEGEPDVTTTLGWAKLELADGTDIEQAVSALEQTGAVQKAQPNFVYHLFDEDGQTSELQADVQSEAKAEAGATGASSATGLTAGVVAQSDSVKDHLSDWNYKCTSALEAQQHCAEFGIDVKDVTVAVIDTGCKADEECFDTSRIVSTYNALDGGSSVADLDGHGTNVASVVAGMTGGVSLYPVKVMDGEGTDSFTMLKAYDRIIQDAETYNIRVVNMSIGQDKPMAEANMFSDYYDWAVLGAIDDAFYAGILPIFPAGNWENLEPPFFEWPVGYSENSIGVINLENLDGDPDWPLVVRSITSNYAVGNEKYLEVAAPGTDIWCPYANYESALGTEHLVTGTSIAAPCVAGACAMAIAANPDLTSADVKSLLCSSAWDMWATRSSQFAYSGSGQEGFDNETGYGLVNAEAMFYGAYYKYGYLSGGNGVARGQTLQLSIDNSSGLFNELAWASDNEQVATVDASGLVRGVRAGQAIITATDASTGYVWHSTICVYEGALTSPASLALGTQGVAYAADRFSFPCFIWSSSNSSVVQVLGFGPQASLAAVGAGTAVLSAQSSSLPSLKLQQTITVPKAANTLKVKLKKRSIAVKAKALKKHRATVKKNTVFSISGAKGAVTFAKAKGSKKISVSKAGKITVAKGLKKGGYAITVKVKAAGNRNYKAAVKRVKLTIRVK